jgi:hypothetical protein
MHALADALAPTPAADQLAAFIAATP